MEEFNVGDVVRLKSGGPKMTVCQKSEVYLCCWFNGEAGEQGSFPAQSLEHAGRKPRGKNRSTAVLMFRDVPLDMRFERTQHDDDDEKCEAAKKPMRLLDGRILYDRCANKKYENGLCGYHLSRVREAGRSEWNESLRKDTA